MAGTKRGPRKKTSSKGKDSSPRDGGKQKQRRQNSGQKEVFNKAQQLSLAVTRHAKKTSTQVVVAATTTITPKQLVHTFDHDKAHETKQDHNSDDSIDYSDDDDDGSKEETTTAPKTLFASSNDQNTQDSPSTPIYKKFLHATNYYKTVYTSDEDSTSDEELQSKPNAKKAPSQDDDDSSNTTMEPHEQIIDTFLPPSKYAQYTPVQKKCMPKNLRTRQRK
jgi:hypothetical protein